MKKSGAIFAAALLSVSLMAGSAFAKPEHANNGQGNGRGNAEVHAEANVDAGGDVRAEANATVTNSTYEEDGSGSNGYKGLLKAIENTKDKPAGAVIAEKLLTKYSVHISEDLQAELETIVDHVAALSVAAEALVESGNVDGAIEVQQDAVRADVKNIDSYKKLGKLYEKKGKKGLKLFVNGEEPSFEVAPFIRDGNTLVPFRAISEALKATVSWDPEERSVTVVRDDITVKLFIDSRTAYVNGEEVELEVPAAIENGNTVIPVRFVSEALKAAVKWEAETETVVIYEE